MYGLNLMLRGGMGSGHEGSRVLTYNDFLEALKPKSWDGYNASVNEIDFLFPINHKSVISPLD